MQYFNKGKRHNNALFVVQTAFHIIELKCKKRKGLNRHKFLFRHFGNFCFMFSLGMWFILFFWSFCFMLFFHSSPFFFTFSCFPCFSFLFCFCFLFLFLYHFIISIFFVFPFRFFPFFFLLRCVFPFLSLDLAIIRVCYHHLPSSFIWAWDQQDLSGT